MTVDLVLGGVACAAAPWLLGWYLLWRGRPKRRGHRCLDFAVLPSGDIKRCIRAAGHPASEQHLWVEAVRADGGFDVARWAHARALTVWHVPSNRRWQAC